MKTFLGLTSLYLVGIQPNSKFHSPPPKLFGSPFECGIKFFFRTLPFAIWKVGCAPDIKTFFFFALHLNLIGKLDVCRRDELFFALRLILGGELESCLFALTCVGSATSKRLKTTDLQYNNAWTKGEPRQRAPFLRAPAYKAITAP